MNERFAKLPENKKGMRGVPLQLFNNPLDNLSLPWLPGFGFIIRHHHRAEICSAIVFRKNCICRTGKSVIGGKKAIDKICDEIVIEVVEPRKCIHRSLASNEL